MGSVFCELAVKAADLLAQVLMVGAVEQAPGAAKRLVAVSQNMLSPLYRGLHGSTCHTQQELLAKPCLQVPL